MTQTNFGTDKLSGGRSVTEEKLLVAVRVRPLRADEGSRIVHVVSDKMLVLEEETDSRRDVLRQRRINDKHYVYDKVFGESSTQDEVYDAVCAPLVGDTLNGIAGAVFAYGATGAGKTHTMTGLMSRALSHLFSAIAKSENPDSFELIETPEPQTKRTRILHKKPRSAVQKLEEASQIVESAKLRNTVVFQCFQEEHETKQRQMAETHELKQKRLAEAHERARQKHLLRLKLLQQQLNK